MTIDKITRCTLEDIAMMIKLQDEFFETADNPDLLRKNDKEMFLECMREPHMILGYKDEGELQAFAILYIPEKIEENLALSLENIQVDELKTANYKYVLVGQKVRGKGLQRLFGELFIKYAKENGIDMLCCTVSPDNIYSIKNMEAIGFKYNRTLSKYGLVRNLYFRFCN